MVSWDEVAFVNVSKYRKKTVKHLLHSASTPSSIAKATEIKISHVSRALSQLKKREIVECLTPNRHKGRIYVLTQKGIDISKKIKESKLNNT